MPSLRKAQESRVLRARTQEFQRADLQRHYGQQHSMESAQRFADGAEDRAEQRQHRAAVQEAETAAARAQALREHQAAEVRRAESAAVEEALQRRTLEQQRAAREVQRLQEESEELRGLQSHIAAAQVRMGQQLQLRERASASVAGRQEAIAMDRAMHQHHAKEEGRRQEENAKRRALAVKARQDLEQQMAGNARLRQLGKMEYQREREAVDASMLRIEEEDRLGAAARSAKRAETRAFIATFLAQQQAIRDEAAAETARQEQAIEEYAAATREQEGQQDARRAANQAVADRNYERLKAEKEAQLAAAEEEERLINLMREEEQEERAQQEAAARAARAEAMRRDMIAANAAQLRLKAERQAQQKAEEAVERQALLERFAEEDRLEQMGAQRRRLKAAVHRREVERLLDVKRVAFEQQQAKEQAEEGAWQAEQARRSALVAEERARLLRGAAHLRDYLPARDAGDIAAMFGK